MALCICSVILCWDPYTILPPTAICCDVGPTLCPLLWGHLHPSPLLYAPPAHLAPPGAPPWPLPIAAGRPLAGSMRGYRTPAPSVAPIALAPGNRYSAAFPRYRHGPVAHFEPRKQSLLSNQVFIINRGICSFLYEGQIDVLRLPLVSVVRPVHWGDCMAIRQSKSRS